MRLTILAASVLNLALITVRLGLYRPLLHRSGAAAFIAEPVLALLVYALAAMLAYPKAGPRLPLVPALCAGAIQVTHLLLENLVDFGALTGIVTLASMIVTFLLWGVAGYLAMQAAPSPSRGGLAGAWSAMLTMSLAVTCGFLLMFSSLPPLSYVATWPEFRSSGWTDVQAFSIANTLESGFSHLLIGPVVGALMGWGAGVVAQFRHPRARTA